MNTPRIILASLSSFCQKLSKLVKIRQSCDKSNFAQFFETRCTSTPTSLVAKTVSIAWRCYDNFRASSDQCSLAAFIVMSCTSSNVTMAGIARPLAAVDDERCHSADYSSTRYAHTMHVFRLHGCQLRGLNAAEWLVFQLSVTVHAYMPSQLTNDTDLRTLVQCPAVMSTTSSSMIVTRLFIVDDQNFPVTPTRVWNSTSSDL